MTISLVVDQGGRCARYDSAPWPTLFELIKRGSNTVLHDTSFEHMILGTCLLKYLIYMIPWWQTYKSLSIYKYLGKTYRLNSRPNRLHRILLLLFWLQGWNGMNTFGNTVLRCQWMFTCKMHLLFPLIRMTLIIFKSFLPFEVRLGSAV